MTIYGVTPSGFKRKTLDEIIADINANAQSTFGAINTSPDSVMGQVIGIFASVVSDQWQNEENIYYSQYPSTAEGASLDNSSEMVGIIRLPATSSTINAHLTGNEGTAIPIGSKIRNPSTNDAFQNLIPGIITQTNAVQVTYNVTTVLSATVYTIVINNSPYQYTSGGGATNSQIANGLVSAINSTTDDEIVAAYTTGGSFTVTTTNNSQGFNAQTPEKVAITTRTSPLVFTAVNTGPTLVLANTINNILTPLAGWSSANNPDNGTVGTNLETDNELRIRRALSLRVPGASSVSAIQAKLLNNVAGVTNVVMYENQNDTTDGEGNPPHSFQAVVVGGSDADVAASIWENKPAGIKTYGNTTVTITDFSGNPQGVSFSRPEDVYVWINCTITCIDEDTFPADGLVSVEAALAAYGNANFNIGDEVFWQEFFAPVYQTINTNIVSVALTFATSSTALGPPGSYSAANVVIAENEIAVFDAARITMALTE